MIRPAPRSSLPRTWGIALAAIVLLGGAAATWPAAPAEAPTTATPTTATPTTAPGAFSTPTASATATVDLAPIVAGWPTSYTTTGTKSEPLYVEHIVVTRDGDTFGLRIDAVMQGDAAGGTQLSAVRVQGGRVSWVTGCTKSAADCADDPALRGFLSSAALLAAAERGALPATAVARDLGGIPVVCVDEAELYAGVSTSSTTGGGSATGVSTSSTTGGSSIARLDPCFSRATGAVLAHWSDASAAFVSATLSSRDLTNEATADTDLLLSLTSAVSTAPTP